MNECHLMLECGLGPLRGVGFRLRPSCFVENDACNGRFLAAACFDVYRLHEVREGTNDSR